MPRETWKMSNQILYDNFVPKLAVPAYANGKLVSLEFNSGPIYGCAAVQPVYASALKFIFANYDPKESVITVEPAVDNIDCGPAFKGENSAMRRDSKKITVLGLADKLPTHYEVRVTYYDRPNMKGAPDPLDPSATTSPDQQKTTQDNL